jgi:hypothetical protein
MNQTIANFSLRSLMRVTTSYNGQLASNGASSNYPVQKNPKSLLRRRWIGEIQCGVAGQVQQIAGEQ